MAKKILLNMKYLNFYKHFKKGNLYLNNFEYLKAKIEFTNCINCKNIPIGYRDKIHLYRLITNYQLLENLAVQEIRFDEKRTGHFGFEYRFYHAIKYDKLGYLEKALWMIEDNIIRQEQYQNEFKKLSIHFSKELQVILKMRFY